MMDTSLCCVCELSEHVGRQAAGRYVQACVMDVVGILYLILVCQCPVRLVVYVIDSVGEKLIKGASRDD